MDEKIFTRNKIRLPCIKQNKKCPKKIRKKERFVQVIAIIIIAFTFAYFIVKSIGPIIEKQCRNMAKSIATKVSNSETTEVMKNYTYDDLIIITKDKDGNIKMVGTNIITVNEIISDIPLHIQEQLEKTENSSFNIHLGSFLGSRLFAGRGPKFKIKMEVIGNLDTDLKSEFTSAGVNQTLHKIYLEIKCNVIILTPFETIEEQIVNQVLLAEGLIVGDVPNAYYNLEGMSTNNAANLIH